MSHKVTIRMMVGGSLEELAERNNVNPLVVGCIDKSSWEIEGQDETDARWQKMQDDFTGERDNYVWREIEVEFDANALRAHLIVPKVPATVEKAP